MGFSIGIEKIEEIDWISGSADSVRHAASRYSSIAEAIRDSADTLRRLAAGDIESESKAVTQFLSNADDLAKKIDKVYDRYDTMGTALTTYARELDDAISSASGAVPLRDSAVAAMNAAEGKVSSHQATLDSNTDPTKDTELKKNVSDAQKDVDAADADGTRAYKTWSTALSNRDEAADRARKAISHSIDHDGMKDSWWDNVSGAWDAFSAWVGDHAGIFKLISQIAGWAATILGVLSIFFPVLAPFALAAGLIALGADLLLAATGNGPWSAVIFDAVGVLSFGAGKALGKAAEATTVAVKANRVTQLAAKTGGRYEGQAARAATAVERSFTRAANKPLSNSMSYVLKNGDRDLGATLKALDRTRVGKNLPGDAVLVNSAKNLIMLNRNVIYGSTAVDLAGKGVDASPASDAVEKATTARISLGSSW